MEMTVPASTILLLETDPTYAETIKNLLTKVGYQVTVTGDADEAFRLASEYHAVIIDVVGDKRSAQEVCREIRATPALAAIPVLCIAQADDVEERVRFLEAGADDVMAKPFDAREMEARVEALLLRFQRSRDLAPSVLPGVMAGPRRRTIALFSPKGGVGTTTIAVNVATVLASRAADRVAIFDLDLQWGQVATHLNLRPQQTVAELSGDEAALTEPELLRSYALRHDSGLHVYCAPRTPDLVETVRPEGVQRFLSNAKTMYEVVVIDAGSTLDERTFAIFEQADDIVFPLYPEIASLKSLHALLDTLSEAGTVAAKTTFVVNHIFAREMLRLRDIENTLAARVSLELPYEPMVYLKAVNEGIPVVRGAPRSAPAERLTRLALQLVGDVPLEALAATDNRRRGLGGLLRRA
jgi:pilus assembly protein CpaE